MSPAPDTAAHPDDAPAARWRLIRDLLIFQLKLFLDGARDVVLLPVSLAAGLFDLLTGNDRRDAAFYAVLRFGRRTEHWIELFGAAGGPDGEDAVPPVVDQVLGRVEEAIVRNVDQGGLSATAKSTVDRMLNQLQEPTRPRSDSPRKGRRRRPPED